MGLFLYVCNPRWKGPIETGSGCRNWGVRGRSGDHWSTTKTDRPQNAIQTAAANGFVVVEAAGNGNVNLDQAACGAAFDRSVRDSGAIIVGAGKAPNSGADRERESFSTYGSRVDLQGWGAAS